MHKNGSFYWVETSCLNLLDNPDVRAVFVASRDITERKRAEEALKESEEKFRSIIEQSAEGMIVTDENGIIEEWNKAQEAMSGLSRCDMVGVSIWDVQAHVKVVPQDVSTLEPLTRNQTSFESFLRGKSDWSGGKREFCILLPDRQCQMAIIECVSNQEAGEEHSCCDCERHYRQEEC